MSETERPVPPPLPARESVPPELLSLRQWVGWRAHYDESKRKWRKPPASPLTGEGIGAVEKYREHFVTFDEAVAGVRQHGLDGVGFVFTAGDSYVGIDFDGARDGERLHPAVAQWFQWFDGAYKERSPSGDGLHIICSGVLPKAVTATPLKDGAGATVELYSSGRYFTWTGQALGTCDKITDCQVGLEKLLKHLDVKAEVTTESNAQRPMSRLTARRLHEVNIGGLRTARQGEGNALLNSAAFFAARAFTAGVLDGDELTLKRQLLDVVTKEWANPHPEGSARETIRSGWSSGALQPLTIQDDEWPEATQVVEEFNKLFYVIENYGGRVRVAWEEESRITEGRSFILITQSFADFHNRYMHQLVQVGEKDDGAPRFESKADVWLKSRNRSQFEKVVFEPGVVTPKDVHNLWRGFAYEPKPGNCDLYLKHLRENICQNDSVKYDYLIGWMAHAVRHPNEQGHVAVVVQGLKGVGKNVFAEGFANLWGQHGFVISDQSRITKNFNAHLRDKCVLVCDEAFFAGDRRHEGVLKALITGSTLTIEAKGVDAVTSPNLLHLIIIGNDMWLVPATREERRFLVVECGARHQQDHQYFQAINDQLRAGGYPALLHHLLHDVDLRRFNVREAPHTAELREQMGESLRGVEAAFFECLQTGLFPGQVQKDGTAQLRTADFLDWARKKDRWSNLKAQHVATLFKDEFGFSRDKPLAASARSRYWVVPALTKARQVWNEKRFATKWPEDGGEWDTILTEEVRF